MDRIFLQEVKVPVRLGMPEWERVLPQTVMLDIEFSLPDARVFVSDAIADTIDYGLVLQRVQCVLSDQTFQLIEVVAERVCQVLLGEFSTSWVRVKASKPGILPGVKQVGVVIERRKAGV